MSDRIALIDLDAMLHIVAHVQYKAGNRDNVQAVVNHVARFISTIQKNVKCDKALLFYQGASHTNFRNEILPEYKGHRVTADAVILWKPTILEVFKNTNAIELRHIESDDAIGILANTIGYGKVVVVSSDKDMLQIPTTHYNPFKAGKADDPSRWITMHMIQANRFFWQQVLCGDSTDMPNSMCGIEGMGPKGAQKLMDAESDDTFQTIVEKAYTKKYGKKSFERANLTYKLVKILVTHSNYINDKANAEIKEILDSYKDHYIVLTDSIENLFEDSF